MNKRDKVLSLLEANQQDYIPAGFFIHFDTRYHRGQAAIAKHLEYYHYTDMDFVKIQFETVFPVSPNIKRPQDWVNLPFYKEDFYEDQLTIVEGLVKAAKPEALVIVTLYSSFMCAGQVVKPSDVLTAHIKEEPEYVKQGLSIMTDSLLLFIKACIKLGVDGFYMSTQGGEGFRFENKSLFEDYIKPLDLILMEEIQRFCPFNVLHVCDYHGGYDDLSPFLEYPGQVVNCSLELGSSKPRGTDISQMFGRPFMGGLDRKGVLVTGSKDDITKAVTEVLDEAPDKFILAADCTLPSDIDWDNIKTAIATAHAYKG